MTATSILILTVSFGRVSTAERSTVGLSQDSVRPMSPTEVPVNELLKHGLHLKMTEKVYHAIRRVS